MKIILIELKVMILIKILIIDMEIIKIIKFVFQKEQ